MARTRKTKSSINYSLDTPYLIQQESRQQQKAEYTALRDIVQKRIKRMAAAKVKEGEANPRESAFYKQWHKGVPKIKELKGNQLPYILAALKQSVSSPESTIKGYKESVRKRVKGMRAAGFKFITAGNLAAFGDFMEEYRSKKLDHIYGSPEVAEFWVTIQKKGIDETDFFNNFNEYMNNRDAIKRMRKPVKTGKLNEIKGYLTSKKRWKRQKSRAKRWK